MFLAVVSETRASFFPIAWSLPRPRASPSQLRGFVLHSKVVVSTFFAAATRFRVGVLGARSITQPFCSGVSHAPPKSDGAETALHG